MIQLVLDVRSNIPGRMFMPSFILTFDLFSVKTIQAHTFLYTPYLTHVCRTFCKRRKYFCSSISCQNFGANKRCFQSCSASELLFFPLSIFNINMFYREMFNKLAVFLNTSLFLQTNSWVFYYRILYHACCKTYSKK